MRLIEKAGNFFFGTLLLILLGQPLSGSAQTATVNAATTYQVIDGFGVAQAFSGPTPSAPINTEFSSTGIGLKYLRLQMYPDNADCAAKDGVTCYSASGGGTIASDDLAVAQTAVANGAVVWASMWSPPASMKSNGSFQGGGNFLGSATNYATLAAIQASFVTLMTGTYGIPIYALSVQNEPNVSVAYQSCTWTAQQVHDYVPYLKSALVAAGYPNVKIMIAEPGGWAQGPSFANTAMSDTAVAADVGILAAHQYDSAYAFSSYNNVTTQHQWETEVSDGNPYDGSMTSGLTYAQLIHNSLVTAKVNAWHFWLATDAAGRGDNEALTNSSMSVAKRAYVMGQWARFVTGMTEIAATANPQSGVYVSAFTNPSTGAFAIVAINSNGGSISQQFSLSGLSTSAVTPYVTDPNNNLASKASVPVSSGSFTVTLTPQSVTTLVAGSNGPGAPTNLTGTIVD
jgi:glucuronoarabinoxylan endo-1,4-beta-xylanase